MKTPTVPTVPTGPNTAAGAFTDADADIAALLSAADAHIAERRARLLEDALAPQDAEAPPKKRARL